MVSPYILHLSGHGQSTGGVYSYVGMNIEFYSRVFIYMKHNYGSGSINWFNGKTSISTLSFSSITKNVWTELEKPLGATDIQFVYVAGGTNSVDIIYSLLV